MLTHCQNRIKRRYGRWPKLSECYWR